MSDFQALQELLSSLCVSICAIMHSVVLATLFCPALSRVALELIRVLTLVFH
jgi:ABC-type spermidine/putrescine transport system permease subunit II